MKLALIIVGSIAALVYFAGMLVTFVMYTAYGQVRERPKLWQLLIWPWFVIRQERE